jgi:hypothetical protein
MVNLSNAALEMLDVHIAYGQHPLESATQILNGAAAHIMEAVVAPEAPIDGRLMVGRGIY